MQSLSNNVTEWNLNEFHRIPDEIKFVIDLHKPITLSLKEINLKYNDISLKLNNVTKSRKTASEVVRKITYS